MIDTDETQRADSEEGEWLNGQGEAPDTSSMASLQLAHRVLAKFPDLTRRYQKFIGTAAVMSSAIIVLTSIAVSKRLRTGESPDKILAEITPDEIENAGKDKPSPPKSEKKSGRLQH